MKYVFCVSAVFANVLKSMATCLCQVFVNCYLHILVLRTFDISVM